MFIFALFTLVLSQNESLIILSPQQLANNSELQQIPFNIAEFSYVPYGQSITGVLEVANPYSVCSPKFNRSVDRSGEQSNVKILLLQRGGCTMTKKTIEAQLLGYQIEINTSLLMISKKQGDLIKKYMDSNDQDKYNVQIVVKFPDIPKTDFVSYIYHFEVIGKQEYTFLQQFYPFHLEMKDQLEFPPYYSIDICGICKRQNYLKQVDQCLSGSRYCESDPDGPGPLKGADSLREIIRQLCIFKQDKDKWWKYVLKFGNQCLQNAFLLLAHLIL